MCQTGKCPYEDYIGDCKLQRLKTGTPEDAFCFDEPLQESLKESILIEKLPGKKGRFRILALSD
jgi:hypothetical protein